MGGPVRTVLFVSTRDSFLGQGMKARFNKLARNERLADQLIARSAGLQEQNVVTEPMIIQNTYVLTMRPWQKAEILERTRHASGSTFTVREFLEQPEDEEIIPFQELPRLTQMVYNKLKAEITSLVSS